MTQDAANTNLCVCLKAPCRSQWPLIVSVAVMLPDQAAQEPQPNQSRIGGAAGPGGALEGASGRSQVGQAAGAAGKAAAESSSKQGMSGTRLIHLHAGILQQNACH